MKRGNAYGDKRTRHVQNKKSTTFFTAVDILHEQRVFTCSKTKSVLKNNVCVTKMFLRASYSARGKQTFLLYFD